MRILIILLFFPVLAMGQSETDAYRWRIDSLRQNFQLEYFTYPDRSFHGGSLNGYYLNGELVYLVAQNAISFYHDSYTAYFRDTELLSFSYEKHIPLEDEFWEKYGELGDSVDYSLMEYDRITLTWRIDFPNRIVKSEIVENGIVDGIAIKQRPENHLNALKSMTDELSDKRIREAQMVYLQDRDFAFTDKWDYPLGVYINQYGQVSCDGFCPEGAWDLKIDGRIPEDSLALFYALVDTTHQPYSLEGKATQYEFFESNYIDFMETEDGIIGRSRCDAGNHSSLHIKINGTTYTAWVEFVSIRDIPLQRFELRSGTLVLDPDMLEDGVSQGIFDFTFENTLDPDLPLTWKGAFFNYIQ